MPKDLDLDPNKPLTTSTAFHPPLAWFLTALQHGRWCWEAHENYQKGGWRNRCLIAGANGPLRLTVPLEGGKHQQMPIRDVRISYHGDWQRQHAQAIRSAYGRSPYFEYYGEAVLEVAARPANFLWDYNLSLTRTVLELVGLTVDLLMTEDFTGGDAGAVVGTTGLPPYPQLFQDRHGFLDGLSVLDGLFCLGPELRLLAHQR